MKNKIRMVIDILMIILFIILMGYHITDHKVHEILGVITFIVFVIHNILNIKWYKTIFKGKYNFYKVFQITVNILLLVSMIGMMISGIMISSHVFNFLNLQTTIFGRNLHMISTSWGFVLMSIHVGLHLNKILFKINKKMKNSVLEYIYYFVIILLVILGLYNFIDNELWKDMLLLNQYKFFDYNQNPYLFYLSIFTIIIFFSFITYYLLILIKKLKKNR